MLLVGLTGGIGSGKSMVAQIFNCLGAYLIDADELAHEAVEPGQPVLARIVEAFGADVLNPDGTLNRAKLGSWVFQDPERRERLNAIVHPYVFMEQERRCKEIVQKDPKAIILFDAALLVETGSYQLMDRVILVTIDREKQIERIMKRDALSRKEALRRIKSQMPQDQKKRKADYIIDGGRPVKEIEDQAQRIYQELASLA